MKKEIRVGTWVQSQTSGTVYIITAIEKGIGGGVYAKPFGYDYSMCIGNNNEEYTVI